jgi:hypothetical protein
MAKTDKTDKSAKAAATRLKNKYRNRALKAWETRRANAIAAGKLDSDGAPTSAESKKRRRIALKSWRTRRARSAEIGGQASA